MEQLMSQEPGYASPDLSPSEVSGYMRMGSILAHRRTKRKGHTLAYCKDILRLTLLFFQTAPLVSFNQSQR
jgi:hypothetical protein